MKMEMGEIHDSKSKKAKVIEKSLNFQFNFIVIVAVRTRKSKINRQCLIEIVKLEVFKLVLILLWI